MLFLVASQKTLHWIDFFATSVNRKIVVWPAQLRGRFRSSSLSCEPDAVPSIGKTVVCSLRPGLRNTNLVRKPWGNPFAAKPIGLRHQADRHGRCMGSPSQSEGDDLPEWNNCLETARLGAFAAPGSLQALDIPNRQLRNLGSTLSRGYGHCIKKQFQIEADNVLTCRSDRQAACLVVFNNRR